MREMHTDAKVAPDSTPATPIRYTIFERRNRSVPILIPDLREFGSEQFSPCLQRTDPESDTDSHTNGDTHGDSWTDPTQGPEEKGGGNEYGASQLDGSNLGQHRRLPR